MKALPGHAVPCQADHSRSHTPRRNRSRAEEQSEREPREVLRRVEVGPGRRLLPLLLLLLTDRHL